MLELEPSSKLWWKKVEEVMKHEAQVSSILALKANDGVWVLDAQGKANLFADTFAGICKLPQPRQDVYTECHQCPEIQGSFVFPSEKQCRDTLANLSEESSTGPDLVPARILKGCAEQLAKPPQILLLRLLETANWPESWREHWIVPIYKKKAVSSAGNNRGAHLTAQLSKVAERLVLPMLETHISHTVACGPNQFAYMKGRGARDALAFLVMSERLVSFAGDRYTIQRHSRLRSILPSQRAGPPCWKGVRFSAFDGNIDVQLWQPALDRQFGVTLLLGLLNSCRATFLCHLPEVDLFFLRLDSVVTLVVSGRSKENQNGLLRQNVSERPIQDLSAIGGALARFTISWFSFFYQSFTGQSTPPTCGQAAMY